MTAQTIARNNEVIELVVYKVKAEHKSDFQGVLDDARQHIMEFSGMLEYRTFRSAKNERLFIDMVRWNNLENALEAAQKAEKMTELAPFFSVFEEIKFMDHFELFNPLLEDKIDLSKKDKVYYTAKEEPQVVELKPYPYLTISGVSAPEDQQFSKAIEAIYAVAFQVKFMSKGQGQDFIVPKMECQWWVESNMPFDEVPREDWHWNIMIRMPDFISKGMIEKAVQEAVTQDKTPQVAEVMYQRINEGKSVQILHTGSYDEEGPTLEKIHGFIANSGLTIAGYHHEIYLNDPRKVEVKNLKTIIRYPVK